MSERVPENRGIEQDPFETLTDVLTAATRYDLALGVIPVAFVVALVAANVVAVSMLQALFLASLVGIAVLIDVLYLNPPA